MIEKTLPEDYVLKMPLREAMTLMATLVWLTRVGEDHTFRLDDAWAVPLGEALAAVEISQS